MLRDRKGPIKGHSKRLYPRTQSATRLGRCFIPFNSMSVRHMENMCGNWRESAPAGVILGSVTPLEKANELKVHE